MRLDLGDADFTLRAALPARSVLFRLSPVGTGSDQQEGLLSLLIRTSRAHAVSPRRLVREVLSAHDSVIAALPSSAFFQRLAGTINGLGIYADTFATTMGRLTGHEDLGHLTMLPWRNLLPRNGNGLLTQHPRWCPACLRRTIECDDEVNYPLVWSLAPYQVCLEHQLSLADACPHCHKAQPFIPKFPDLAACDHCGGSLVTTKSDHGTTADPSQVWAAEAVGGMVSRNSASNFNPTVEFFRAFVTHQVAGAADGNRAKYCRHLGINIHGLNGWLNKDQRPSIGQLLTFCHGAGVMPSEVFGSPLRSHAFQLPGGSRLGITTRRPSPRLPKQEQANIQMYLQEQLDRKAGRSLSEVAREAGVTPGYVRYWFPELSKQLCDQHRDVRNRRSTEYHAKQCAEVFRVVKTLKASGIYPSRRQVDRRLQGTRMSLALPYLQAAYAEAIEAS